MFIKSKVSKDLEQRWQDRIAWIKSANFDIRDTEEVKSKRIQHARLNYDFFVAHYFPHLANKKNAKFHKEAAEIVKQSKDLRALFEWARGHAKSSHASLLIPLWLLFQPVPELHFMVLVSKSQEAAIRLLSDLQAELEFNELLINDFGRQVKDGNWTEGEFITTGGCMFLALG